MDYFFSIFVGCMFIALIDRLFLSCFSVEEEEERRDIRIYEEDSLERVEYENVGVYGRTNSESSIKRIRKYVKRSKTI